ncbi:MAG: hypothetical protein K0R65_2127 [Crocinitomicaceae bacterium]|jgi:hypothetical protein|nr:hypothetical protein [Crocinitomicaceae bacterium]
MKYSGLLRKMRVTHLDPVQYELELGETIIMNELIGRKIRLNFSGEIICVCCGKKTKSSFNQGFCFSCFQNSPESSECIIRPELCRAHLNEGRDIEWELSNHNQPHVVYLAASDSVKVGVTRHTQMPARWIDQGASSAIIIAEVSNRYLAGMLEVELKNHFKDKTNWQRMLRNEIDDSIDLVEAKWALEEVLPADIIQYFSEDDTIIHFNYPVGEYPSKVKSMSFDKDKLIEGTLTGIKGQYLILDGMNVLNLRKHTAYQIDLELID